MRLLKSIQNELRLQWQNFWAMGLVTVGLFSAGQILLAVVVGIGVADTFATISTIFALMGLVFWYFTVGVQFALGLNYAVVMSRTRKEIIATHYAVNLLYSVAHCLLLVLLYRLDLLSHTLFYADLMVELDVGKFFTLPIMASVCIAGLVAASFFSALVVRFGHKVLWVLWALWMFVFLVLPRASAAAQESDGTTLIGRCALWVIERLRAIPIGMWQPLAAACVVLCIVLSVLLMRRYAVKN